MLRLIASRLLQLPLILGVVFLATFLLAWVMPGNPLEQPDRALPAEIEEAMLRQYNLHDPVAFLVSYLDNLLFRGDFGPSLRYRDQRVNDILASGLPVSMALGTLGLAIALLVGLTAGLIGAAKPGSVLDLASLLTALLGVSLPVFVTATLLLVVFAGLLGLLPVTSQQPLTRPAELVLPALALAAMPAAYIARLTRLGLADVMSSDYVRTAHAKGLPFHRVLFKHALKVAFLPVLSFLGPAAASTLTGSFVVEQVFAIPGIGDHFVQAVLNKDQFLILGIVLVYATLLVLFNLVVDVLYAAVDPRIDLAGDAKR